MESKKPLTKEKETKQSSWSEKLMSSPRVVGFSETSGSKKETEILNQTMEKLKIPEKVTENQKKLDQSDRKPEEESDLNKQIRNLKAKLQENKMKFKISRQNLEENIEFLEQDRSNILTNLNESIKETEYYKRATMQQTKLLVDQTANFKHFYYHIGPHYEQQIEWMTRRIDEFKAHIDAEMASGARIEGLEKEVEELRDKLRSVTSVFGISSEDNHFDEYEFVEPNNMG